MKKFLTSFVFLVLFAGYAAFQYLANGTIVSAANQNPAQVTTAQTQTSGQPLASSASSAQSGSVQSASEQQENVGDGGTDDSSETTVVQTQTTQSNVASASTQPSKTTSTPTQAQPTPVAKPKGQYVDGTYTGSVANAYYGNVQVQAVISGGKLVNVVVLQYPNDRSTSRYINQQAMPILVSEAISAQSANINGVSGASESSPAFAQSLASALSQAKS
ncbi:MAG: hypothetical protein P4L81_05775 [Candidatus Pacebacteria bacterium]|nr:hypothetical protein [Candidatus Paceibacterota bacterium]